MNLDLYIIQKLNGLVADKGHWYDLINALGENPFIRGTPIFICLFYVWFSKTDILHKSKIILGFFGILIALTISVYCQSHLHFHLRPIFDASINIANPNGWKIGSFGKRIYSFPSDTATVYFALSFIVFLANKKLGTACLVWNILTIGVSRVALGFHYPSDILAGLILGGGLVFTCTKIKFAQNFMGNLLAKYDVRFTKVNIFVCLFCAEAYSLFPGLLPIYHFLIKILNGESITSSLKILGNI
jgi:membrane-associated phospholipid phosphatase